MCKNKGSGGSGKKKKGKVGIRTIIYAVGLEWEDEMISEGKILFYPYELPITAITSPKYGNFWKYQNPNGIVYRIKIVKDKVEFKKWLETPGAVVVYYGHARFGRGPCFGECDVMTQQPRRLNDPSTPDELCVCPGQKWGDTKNPSIGLYRMGYPYIGIFAAEILDHGYKANLVPTSVPIYKVRKKNIHPWLYRPIRKKKLIKLTIDEIIDNLKEIQKKLIGIHRLHGSTALNSKFGENLEAIYQLPLDNFRNLVSGNYPSNQKFWCYYKQSSYRYQIMRKRKGKRKKRKVWRSVEVKNIGVVLKAGWSDLRETEIKCRGFAFFGCHTYVHNRKIVRKHRKWKFDGKKGYAYFTKNEGHGGAKFFIYHLITSPFISWKKSMQHACRKCRVDLPKYGKKYTISCKQK